MHLEYFSGFAFSSQQLRLQLLFSFALKASKNASVAVLFLNSIIFPSFARGPQIGLNSSKGLLDCFCQIFLPEVVYIFSTVYRCESMFPLEES